MGNIERGKARGHRSRASHRLTPPHVAEYVAIRLIFPHRVNKIPNPRREMDGPSDSLASHLARIGRRPSRSRPLSHHNSPEIPEADIHIIDKLADDLEASLQSRPEFGCPPRRGLHIAVRLMYSYGVYAYFQYISFVAWWDYI